MVSLTGHHLLLHHSCTVTAFHALLMQPLSLWASLEPRVLIWRGTATLLTVLWLSFFCPPQTILPSKHTARSITVHLVVCPHWTLVSLIRFIYCEPISKNCRHCPQASSPKEQQFFLQLAKLRSLSQGPPLPFWGDSVPPKGLTGKQSLRPRFSTF